MENNNIDLYSLIDKALSFYDKKNREYNKYLNLENISIDREKTKIIFNDNDKEFNYEVLGVFDNTTNIWMWAWMVPEFMYNETELVRKLLNYGLKITPTSASNISPEKIYLKTEMVNSRFMVKDEFQLQLHLAISCYLSKDNIKFIYSKKKYLNKDKTKYITVYYLII
jgi:hypothetical protein